MPATKKSTKKPAKKSVVGGLKSKPKWKIAFLAVVILLFVASVEYAAYNKIRADKLVAQAAGYTYIGTDSVAAVYACKTYIPVYGGVYSIKVLYIKSSLSFPSYYRVATYRGLSLLNAGEQSNLYWNRLAGTQTANLSALRDDTFRIYLDGQNTARGGGPQLTHFESKNYNHANVVSC